MEKDQTMTLAMKYHKAMRERVEAVVMIAVVVEIESMSIVAVTSNHHIVMTIEIEEGSN